MPDGIKGKDGQPKLSVQLQTTGLRKRYHYDTLRIFTFISLAAGYSIEAGIQ